jgi:PASTA domain
MKRRLFTVTLLITLAALVVFSTPSHAAYVSRATVNTDRSVTIEWTLASTDFSNTSVAVDCCVVHTWYAVDRSTTYTTAPLAAGRHTITLEVLEMYWTNTDYGPANCRLSSRPTYRWVCAWSRWTTVTVRVPSSSSAARCVVPLVRGLRIEDAKAQIRIGGCTLGAVTRKNADRASGVVLAQQPKLGTQLPEGTAITLVVSKGPSLG